MTIGRVDGRTSQNTSMCSQTGMSYKKSEHNLHAGCHWI